MLRYRVLAAIYAATQPWDANSSCALVHTDEQRNGNIFFDFTLLSIFSQSSARIRQVKSSEADTEERQISEKSN